MKSKRILMSSFGAISMAMAFCSYAEQSTFNSGFYAAGKGGTEEIRGRMDVQTTQHVVELLIIDANTTQTLDDVPLYKNYGVGNLALGANLVGLFHNRFMIGIELSGNIAGEEEVSLQDTETTDVTFVPGSFPLDHTDFNAEYEVAFTRPDLNTDLRAGFLIMPNFLIYGRVGAAFNEVEQSIDSTYTVTDVLGSTDQAVTHSEDKDGITGLRVGLGLEYKISDRFGMTMDYIYTDYGTVRHSDTAHDNIGLSLIGGDTELLPVTVTSDVETELSKQTFLLGAVVYFGGSGKRDEPVYNGPDK